MASSTIKQTCMKCNKCGGIATCNGCQGSFCTKHFIEHRQELSQQMDYIGQEHDLLRRDINYEQNIDSFLVRIDQWEQETIRTIRASAEKARTDLQQLFEQKKIELKMSINRLTEELRTCRESDDYTELDIKKWTEQLKELRQMIENSSNINIACEHNATSGIPLIKITGLQQLTLSSNQERRLYENDNRISEKFAEFYGNITLSTDGLIGYCSYSRWDGSCVAGIGRYSSGIHHIHFRIENKISNFLFFGIMTALQKVTHDISQVKSVYGWWELGFAIVNGSGISENQQKTINSNDEITLTLNCDNHLIQLNHRRLNRFVEIPIDIEQCPFPWKIVIRLDSEYDCVKILH